MAASTTQRHEGLASRRMDEAVRRGFDVHRARHPGRREVVDDRVELGMHGRERRGVSWSREGAVRDGLAEGFVSGACEKERAGGGGRDERARIARAHGKRHAEQAQQIARDEAEPMGSGRRGQARCRGKGKLGSATSADRGPVLEHVHAETAAGQHEGTDEPVRSCSDHDDVEIVHAQRSSMERRRPRILEFSGEGA
jgi:hypothetical protein